MTQPAARPDAVWTSSVDAPEGTLSHDLERQRHDSFIARAQEGSIDLVFLGTTETEMWSWRERGRNVWDEAFGSLSAANFGSQGTNPQSLLWRMQNGELDGYQAKLVVWQTWRPAAIAVTDGGRPDTEATYAPIIAELKARQLQATILLMAPLPRGDQDRDSWRRDAAAHAAMFDEFVDNETVFYLDIGERFFQPDGSHNQAMWRYPPVSGPVNVGTQTSAYDVWAQELQPWIDRFVR